MPRDALLLVILVLLMGYIHELRKNGVLSQQVELYREQVSLLETLRTQEAGICIGTYRINTLCVETIRGLLRRLGIESEDMESAIGYAIVRRVEGTE